MNVLSNYPIRPEHSFWFDNAQQAIAPVLGVNIERWFFSQIKYQNSQEIVP
ncbi:MAG: hypothetical protein PUP90_14725 [Nostoc sp. S4]|nr:hypothetical protein [Nostoc sp. S4]